jgi:hypothetical protein
MQHSSEPFKDPMEFDEFLDSSLLLGWCLEAIDGRDFILSNRRLLHSNSYSPRDRFGTLKTSPRAAHRLQRIFKQQLNQLTLSQCETREDVKMFQKYDFFPIGQQSGGVCFISRYAILTWPFLEGLYRSSSNSAAATQVKFASPLLNSELASS